MPKKLTRPSTRPRLNTSQSRPPVTRRPAFIAPPPKSSPVGAEEARFSHPSDVEIKPARQISSEARAMASARMRAVAPADGGPRPRRRGGAPIPESFPEEEQMFSREEEIEEQEEIQEEEAEAEYPYTEPDRPDEPAQAIPPARAFVLKPEPSPAAPSPATRPASGLYLESVAVEDVDRLWDWIRQDGDGGMAFFSRPITNSLALHKIIGGLVQAEQDGTGIGIVRSILYTDPKNPDPLHLGLVMLYPILDTEKVALLHLYLAPRIRGEIGTVTADLVHHYADSLVPGYRLAVWSSTPALQRLHHQVLSPLGFTQHTVFVR